MHNPQSPDPAAANLAAGSLVTNNVRLVRQIAEGGMGCIWRAHHAGLETDVAVKFVSPEAARLYPSVAARFEREAKMTANIRSVHVVRSFDHGVTPDGARYIVMELLEGETLDERLEARGPLSLREAAQVVSQVAKVLQRAHDAGIVHRDIKPENVFLVDSDYEIFVKLLDFGIAKRVSQGGDNVTKTGAVVGTPGFIAPEQALNAKRVDQRADLWSLAALAYNALTGKLAYGEDDTEPWFLRLMKEDFAAPSTLRPDLPGGLDAWFKKALHPKPARRFGSARAMASALAAFASERPPPPEEEPASSSDLASTSEWVRPAQFDLFAVDSERAQDGTVVMRDAREDSQEQPVPTFASPLPPPPYPARRRTDYARVALLGALCIMVVTMAALLVLYTTQARGETRERADHGSQHHSSLQQAARQRNDLQQRNPVE